MVSENPHLYYEIQHGNRKTPEVVAAFREVLEELAVAVTNGEETEFVAAMGRADQRLNPKGQAPG